VQGSVVGDLIHLLAELVDNATAFSPPDATVTVRGNAVGKGVVVEVEDQGLGIEYAKREQLNETLRHPPGFQEMTVSGQRHIGLFVVGQLAQRHGIAVSLQDSAYGGVKAIVLIPARLVETEADGPPAPVRAGRHEQLPGAPALPGPGALSRPAGGDGADSLGQRTGPPRRGRAPLQRRERLANLAPELRADTTGAGGQPAPRRPQRSPDQARGSMSAFQRGSRLGRDSASEDTR
jgi:hypothetical protein